MLVSSLVSRETHSEGLLLRELQAPQGLVFCFVLYLPPSQGIKHASMLDVCKENSGPGGGLPPVLGRVLQRDRANGVCVCVCKEGERDRRRETGRVILRNWFM